MAPDVSTICLHCHGTGRTVCDRYSDGRPAAFKPCSLCRGTGKKL